MSWPCGPAWKSASCGLLQLSCRWERIAWPGDYASLELECFSLDRQREAVLTTPQVTGTICLPASCTRVTFQTVVVSHKGKERQLFGGEWTLRDFQPGVKCSQSGMTRDDPGWDRIDGDLHHDVIRCPNKTAVNWFINTNMFLGHRRIYLLC